MSKGGALVKPVWDGPEMPKGARTDFQMFFQERFEDVLGEWWGCLLGKA